MVYSYSIFILKHRHISLIIFQTNLINCAIGGLNNSNREVGSINIKINYLNGTEFRFGIPARIQSSRVLVLHLNPMTTRLLEQFPKFTTFLGSKLLQHIYGPPKYTQIKIIITIFFFFLHHMYFRDSITKYDI